MVYPTGFADQEEFERLLVTAHALRVDIDVLDLDHNGLGSITDRFLDGSVDIDTTADVTRSCKLQLLDYDRSLNFDPAHPDDGGVYADRMVRIWYCVGRLDLSRWYRVPIFTGPITKVDRDGVLLNLEGMGKEVLSNSPVWHATRFGEGMRVQIVRRIMEFVGETLFLWLDTNGTKTHNRTMLNKSSSALAVARKLARAAGLQLFYNGYGTLVLRAITNKRQWTFDGAQIVDAPQVGFDMTGTVNAVDFVGGKPKGAKKIVTAKAVAPKNHSLSPWSLGRKRVDGTTAPRFLPVYLEDSGVTKQSEANERVKTELKQGLKESVDASFTVLPVPHLEELDDYDIVTPDYSAQATLTKTTIPLRIGTQSIGYTKNVSPSRLSKALRRL